MRDNRNIALGIGGLLVFVGAYFVFSQLRPTSSQNQNTGVTFKQVDRLRKDVEHHSQLQRDRALLDNYKNAPTLSSGYRAVPSQAQDNSLQLQSSVNHAAEDSKESRIHSPSLDNKINDFLISKQRYEQLSQIERQKYISNFKREALAMGYQLEFNDKLEVIKFDRVPASQKPSALKAIPPPPPPSNGVDGQESYDDAGDEE